MSKNNTMSIPELTEWFCQGKYGVMMHFLGDYRSSDEQWNERVNAFDCEGLAKQLHQCGANHFLFTISQCGGRFCMPLESYSKILCEAGYNKKLCSDRDLIADLIKALDKYGISLMLYAAAEGPHGGDMSDIFDWDAVTGPGESFKLKYFSMLKEISLRYGEKVKGWWIDGCYRQYPQFAEPDTDYALEMTDVLQSGNPNSMVAYNPGVVVEKVTTGQEYTCGESAPFMYYPEDRFLDGSQWHVLTYLGPSWCQKGSAYSSIDLVNYTKECTDKGGVITFDVFYGPTGLIVPEHFEQLMVIKSFIKDRDSFDIKDIPESQNYLDGLSTLEVMDHIPYNYINIALRKPATASSYFHSSFDSCLPEYAVNGSSKNGWAPDINDWSGSWLQIDLLKPERIDAIEMVDRNMGLDERKCFEIRASNDPEFNTYEVLLHQGEIALPWGRKWTKLINLEHKYRYIRFQAMPNNRHFVSQLKVYQDLSK